MVGLRCAWQTCARGDACKAWRGPLPGPTFSQRTGLPSWALGRWGKAEPLSGQPIWILIALYPSVTRYQPQHRSVPWWEPARAWVHSHTRLKLNWYPFTAKKAVWECQYFPVDQTFLNISPSTKNIAETPAGNPVQYSRTQGSLQCIFLRNS